MELLDSSVLLTDELANAKVSMVGLFPKGHVTLLVGEPGIGKTWFMLSIAKSVASGSHGLGGIDMFYPKGKTLIFAGETGVRLLASRIKLMGGIEPLESCRVISSHICANMNLDMMVNTAIGRKNIEKAVATFKPDIVFFDTMISFMADGKDESSQVDMTDAIRGLGAIASACNTAMVVVHHFRKRQSSTQSLNRTMDEVIGSSAFIRLASLVIGVERKHEERRVSCLKSWWEEFAPFTFRITSEDGVITLAQNYGYYRDGTYSISKVSDGLATGILRGMRGEDFTVSDVVGEFGAARTSAIDAIVRLMRNGDVIELPEKRARASVYRVVDKEVRANEISLFTE